MEINNALVTTIGSEERGFNSFARIRVCLDCGAPGTVQAGRCEHCRSENHTTTMLIVSLRRVEGRPVVTVKNFGNHEV
jgi:ribosomal protein L40E